MSSDNSNKNAHTINKCPVCKVPMRNDTLIRHLYTHRKSIDTSMMHSDIQKAINCKTPVMWNVSKNIKESWAVCLICKKGCTGYTKSELAKDFVAKHMKSECCEQWDTVKDLYGTAIVLTDRSDQLLTIAKDLKEEEEAHHRSIVEIGELKRRIEDKDTELAQCYESLQIYKDTLYLKANWTKPVDINPNTKYMLDTMKASVIFREVLEERPDPPLCPLNYNSRLTYTIFRNIINGHTPDEVKKLLDQENVGIDFWEFLESNYECIKLWIEMDGGDELLNDIHLEREKVSADVWDTCEFIEL